MLKDRIRLVIPSHPKYLSLVRDVTESIGQIFKIDGKETGNIKLAIDEACSNVIKHAYSGDVTKEIELGYEITESFIKVVIDDNGKKTNLHSLKGRNLDDVRPGGLGVHFIRKIFDVMSLDEKKKHGNRLVLIKYICSKNT